MNRRSNGQFELKPINWDEFDKLASFQCTQAEIAAFFDVSVDTLDRALQRDHGVTLAEFWSKRRFLGKVRLRKAQFAIVEKGGPGAATMAIYLDKKMFPDENPDKPQAPPPPSNVVAKIEMLTFEQFCANAGYPVPYPKQVEMKDFAITEGQPRLLLGARGYGKTDYVTIMGEAYEVYKAWFQYTHNGTPMDETCLIITKSKTRNTALIGEIADALVANGVELEKENASLIRVKGHKKKDHTVEVITIKSSFRGRHPKRILMDDPVTEEDTSEAMRVLVKKKYDEAYKLCKNIVIIGQPAHAFDLYAELRNKLQKLEVPHGTIPELDADLEAMLSAGIDPGSISMSYHLKVPETGTVPFANIKYVDKFPAGESVAFIDPSDGGDFTALSIFRGYMEGVAVQGHAWQRAWYHCMDQMVEIFKARKVTNVCFETNKFGLQPLDQLRQVLGPLGIRVVGVNSDTNKEAVIMAAGSFAHLIHLSKESDATYTKQVVQYDHTAKFDDAPDSLARGLVWMGLIKGKKR